MSVSTLFAEQRQFLRDRLIAPILSQFQELWKQANKKDETDKVNLKAMVELLDNHVWSKGQIQEVSQAAIQNIQTRPQKYHYLAGEQLHELQLHRVFDLVMQCFNHMMWSVRQQSSLQTPPFVTALSDQSKSTQSLLQLCELSLEQSRISFLERVPLFLVDKDDFHKKDQLMVLRRRLVSDAVDRSIMLICNLSTTSTYTSPFVSPSTSQVSSSSSSTTSALSSSSAITPLQFTQTPWHRSLLTSASRTDEMLKDKVYPLMETMSQSMISSTDKLSKQLEGIREQCVGVKEMQWKQHESVLQLVSSRHQQNQHQQQMYGAPMYFPPPVYTSTPHPAPSTARVH